MCLSILLDFILCCPIKDLFFLLNKCWWRVLKHPDLEQHNAKYPLISLWSFTDYFPDFTLLSKTHILVILLYPFPLMHQITWARQLLMYLIQQKSFQKKKTCGFVSQFSFELLMSHFLLIDALPVFHVYYFKNVLGSDSFLFSCSYTAV